jgi:hypothetical protein
MRILLQLPIQGFDNQKLKKFPAGKKFFFLSKFAFYLFLGLRKECPRYRRTVHLSKEKHVALKNFFTFVGHFCPPGSKMNVDPEPQNW